MGDGEDGVASVLDVRAVRRDDHGAAGVAHPPQRVEDQRGVGAVEGTGGLVREDQGRPLDQQAGQRDALPLAAAELTDLVLSPPGEVDPLQRGAVAATVPPGRDLQVVGDGGVLDQRVVLEQVAEDVPAEEPRGAGPEPGQVGAVVEDAAAGRRLQQADAVEQRRLARSAGAGHGEHLARLDGEVEVRPERPAAEGLGQAPDGEHGGPPVGSGVGGVAGDDASVGVGERGDQ